MISVVLLRNQLAREDDVHDCGPEQTEFRLSTVRRAPMTCVLFALLNDD